MSIGLVQRWSFYDPSTGSYTFPINPNEGGTPYYQKTLTELPTTAGDGRSLIFEGADPPSTIKFSGVLQYISDAEVFLTWFHKHRQIKVTNDLGTEFWIYITDLELTRKRSQNHPTKMLYRVSALILDSTTETNVSPFRSELLLESGGALLLESGDILLLDETM